MKLKIKNILILISALLIMAAATGHAGNEAVKKGGRLVIALPAEPMSLDPVSHPSGGALNIIPVNVLESFVAIDANGFLKPGLAERWEVSSGGKEYIFHLKKKVRFHNKEKFGPQTSVMNLKRIMAGTKDVHLQAMTGATAERGMTIKVTLSRPDYLFLNRLASTEGLMLPKNGRGPAATFPVGTGPFNLIAWEKGRHIDLVKNKAYHNKNQPYLDKITYRFIPDPVLRLAALKTGKADVILGFSSSPEQAGLISSQDGYKIIRGLGSGEVLLSFNHASKPLDDVRVRRAILMAIDRNQLIELAMFGNGKAIGSHWSPAQIHYLDLTESNPYNLEKAKSVLKETIDDAFEINLKIPDNGLYLKRTALVLAGMIRNAGLKLNIKTVSSKEWKKQVFVDKDFQLALNIHPGVWDIDLYARDNYLGYESERFTAAYNRAIASLSEDSAANYFKLSQRILAEDAAAGFLFSMPTIIAARSEVIGLWANFPEKIFPLKKVWIKNR